MKRASEELYAGAGRPARGRARGGEEDALPPRVGFTFLALLVAGCAAFVALGAYKVHSVFAIRDDEMEAARLSGLVQERRDRQKALTARVSQLHRAEVLKAAAQDHLALGEPEPGRTEILEVPADVQQRWTEAVQKARRHPNGKEDSPQ